MFVLPVKYETLLLLSVCVIYHIQSCTQLFCDAINFVLGRTKGDKVVRLHDMQNQDYGAFLDLQDF